MNHVTQEDEHSAWIPSLGPAWGNWCSSRLFLYRKRKFRFAYLYRLQDNTTNGPVQFQIKVILVSTYEKKINLMHEKDRGISDPIDDEIETEEVDQVQTQKQLDDNIELSFTQLRREKNEADEQKEVDKFWDSAYMDET